MAKTESVAVATFYSFDVGQVKEFRSEADALEFIRQTKDEEIRNDRDEMGYEFRETLGNEPGTFTYDEAPDGSWFRIEEIRRDGAHDTTIWFIAVQN